MISKEETMANITLGKTALQEIETAMTGLKGTPAKQMADYLADKHGVTYQHIYKKTEHLRPKNKTRSDKGKRKFEMSPGTDTWEAVKLVLGGRLDPEQSLLTAKMNNATNLPSLAYFRRMLHQAGLNKEQRESSRRPFRLWQSEMPGQMVQIDVTALKVRWEDKNTRRILRIEGIDKNHPQLDDKKIRVWQIMAVDDFSRRKFMRYVSTIHITSRDIIEFCCELFEEWGVPESIYTDNGSEFKGYFIRAEKILNMVLADKGGFEHKRHLPGNPQASGKVENAHQAAERADKYVGLAVEKGQIVTIKNLNEFARDWSIWINNRLHRATNQTPITRWHSKIVKMRVLPREIIESALLADEFEITLDHLMTVSHKGVIYSIPGEKPFVNYVGQKVSVVIPLTIDLMLIKLPNEKEYREVPKIVHTADTAGDFKSHAETTAQQIRKMAVAEYKADNKAAKEKLKQTGEIFRIPHFNTPIEIPETNVAHFPHKEHHVSADEIAAVVPVAPSVYAGKLIDYWKAVGIFADRFDSAAECRDFLRAHFADDEQLLPSKQVEEIVESRETERQPTRHLRAV